MTVTIGKLLECLMRCSPSLNAPLRLKANGKFYKNLQVIDSSEDGLYITYKED